MSTKGKRRIVKLVLILAIIAMVCSVLLLMPVGIVKAGSGDNYPSEWKSNQTWYDPCKIDTWGYCQRWCTSWVAWALHDRNGFEMTHAIGNASQWKQWAIDKYTVDNTPAKGAVAWFDIGSYGHVAYVEELVKDGNGTVTQVKLSEYNWEDSNGDKVYGNDGTYSTRTVAPSVVSKFIHFSDLSSSSTPTPTATPTPSAATLVARYSYNRDVFYTLNGDLVSYWGNPSAASWTRWTWPLDAVGKPAVAVRNNGDDVAVFYRGKDSSLKQVRWNQPGLSWYGPETIVSSGVWSDPVAVARDNTHMEVAWVDTNHALKTRGWDWGAGGWLGINTVMAADVASHPTLGSRSSNSLDGFVIKNNGNIVHYYWNGSWHWEDWYADAVGSPAIGIPNDGAVDGLYRKNVSWLQDRWWDWRYGWQFREWQASMATDPAVSTLYGTVYAAYVETGGNMVIRRLSDGYSKSVFYGADRGFTPSLLMKDYGLELLFWADDGSLKRLRIDSNLNVATSQTVAQAA